MKKNILLFILALFLTVFQSCEKNSNEEIDNAAKIKEVANHMTTRKDFGPIIFGDQNSKGGPDLGFVFTTQSDYVSGENGCYTVNVRVYVTTPDGTVLVANQNVKVGNCGKNNILDSGCSGYLPDGNLVLEDDNHNLLCLYDVLTKNQIIYKSYRESIAKLLKSHK